MISVSRQRLRVHSHIRLYVPGRGRLAQRRSFPMPEWPGLHAKSPT
jgi:hypothetical protein